MRVIATFGHLRPDFLIDQVYSLQYHHEKSSFDIVVIVTF
jgi:hypothetical protein